MTDEQLLKRISTDPKIMLGKPVIRGTRLTVEYIMNRLAHGDAIENITAEYTDLSSNDIQACLLFARSSGYQSSIRPSII